MTSKQARIKFSKTSNIAKYPKKRNDSRTWRCQALNVLKTKSVTRAFWKEKPKLESGVNPSTTTEVSEMKRYLIARRSNQQQVLSELVIVVSCFIGSDDQISIFEPLEFLAYEGCRIVHRKSVLDVPRRWTVADSRCLRMLIYHDAVQCFVGYCVYSSITAAGRYRRRMLAY